MALGLLSTDGGFGYGRSSVKQSRIGRDKLRGMRRSMHAPGVALRFLLARPQRATRLAAACHDRKKGWSAACATADRGVASELAAAHAEQREFSDLVFLNGTERFCRCPLKYVLWLRVARTRRAWRRRAQRSIADHRRASREQYTACHAMRRPGAQADIVIEAAFERMAVKKEIFKARHDHAVMRTMIARHHRHGGHENADGHGHQEGMVSARRSTPRAASTCSSATRPTTSSRPTRSARAQFSAS